jgi:hypothetical protein
MIPLATNTACSGRWGFCGLFKQFCTFRSDAFRRPPSAPNASRWGATANHCLFLIGYNFLSLSLALGIVKRQSIVARAAFRSDSQAPPSLVTITWLLNLRSNSLVFHSAPAEAT